MLKAARFYSPYAMRTSGFSLFVLCFLLGAVIMVPYGLNIRPARAVAPLPVVGVWSSTYKTSNITVVDGSLGPNSQFILDVNVTNAPSFNGYELALFYDRAYLSFVSESLNQNTVFNTVFLNPSTGNGTGMVRLSVVSLSGPFNGGDGFLAHITFKVLAVGVSPLTLAAGTSLPSRSAQMTGGFTPDWTRLVLGRNPIDVSTSDGYFKNMAGKSGPVASFTPSPMSPAVGGTVTFDARGSFDLDSRTGAGIRRYFWDFGDGKNTDTNLTRVDHSYPSGTSALSGNFSARLTVVDIDDGFQGMTVRLVTISPPQQHDVAVLNVTVSPSTVPQGQNVSVNVIVGDLGAFPESFNLTVYENTVSATLILGNLVNQPISVGEVESFIFILDTRLLAPGNYIVGAVATIASDSNPGNNALTTTLTVTSASIDRPPIANFTFTPSSPLAEQSVQFDGSLSADPDGFITGWEWAFGDSSFTAFGTFVSHTFASPGNYTVSLTVTDNSGLTSTRAVIVHVGTPPAHDVAITGILTEPQTAVQGQTVGIGVVIVDNGLQDENVTVTAYYDSTHVIGTRSNVEVVPNDLFGNVIFFEWDTTGVPVGNHTISATAFLPNDQSPSDNSFTDGQVSILPPPILTVTPDSGPLGTQVLIHGSGFPTAEFGPSELFISFDDQFLGLAFPQNGTFTFIFNVPHADPARPHQVKAFDPSTRLTAAAGFGVLPTPPPPGDLEVVVSVGTVYFPGETSVIYVLTTLNGSPVGSGVQLQIQVFKPDGSTASLTAVSVAPGLYKATFTVPKTGSMGTYAVLASAGQNGQNATGLGSFEVKPSWLSTQSGRTTTTGLALVGIVSILAVASWKGPWRKPDRYDNGT